MTAHDRYERSNHLLGRRRFLGAAAGVGATLALPSASDAAVRAASGVKNDPRLNMTLPNNARIVFTVSVAFEAHPNGGNFGNIAGKGTEASRSYSQYAYDVGVWRILEMLERHSINGSFSTHGLAAKEHPECVRAMIENGHESYSHGWGDGLATDADIEGERKQIRDTTAAITDAGGVRPVGWSGPGSQNTVNTLRLLVEEGGYKWSGDDSSSDIPYLRKVNGKTLAVLPRVNFATNDLIMIHGPQNPPSVLFENFKDTFDTLYEEGRRGRPQWMDLMLHCDIGARPPYAGPFQRALAYAKGFPGVWQPRRRELAEWTLKSQPVVRS